MKVTNFMINVQNVSPRKRKSCIKSSELNNYKTSTVSNYICMVATNHIEMGFTRKLRPVPGPGIEAEGLVLAENFEKCLLFFQTLLPYVWANYFAHPISFLGMVKMVWKISRMV